MPDIFIPEKIAPIKTNGSDFVQPIREATLLLIGKIIFALLIPMILYLIVVATSVEIAHLFSFEQDWNLSFFLFLLILMICQTFLILFIVLQWKNHVFYITETYIQETKGVFIHSEKMYDLKNVRNISIRQGILGRMFHFGDLIIESTAPNFEEVIIMMGVPNPKQHEVFLRKFV